MPFKSNINKTLIPIAEQLKNLSLEIELKMGAEYSVGQIKSRLSKGLGPNGEVLNTKAKVKEGRYSKRHAEARRYEGLTTSVRNLNFTGNMIDGFGVTTTSKKKAEIGFKNIEDGKLANYNENYMELEVFVPNDKDIQQVKTILEKKILAIIK
jgi:hypothetical protein